MHELYRAYTQRDSPGIELPGIRAVIRGQSPCLWMNYLKLCSHLSVIWGQFVKKTNMNNRVSLDYASTCER